MLIEIQNRQSKRKTARRKYNDLHEEAPAIDLDDSEFTKKRTALKKEYQAECQGVDADIDWLQASLRLAVKSLLQRDGNEQPALKDIDEMVNAFGSAARPHLSTENQQTLSQEADRAAEQEAEAKRQQDREIKEQAEEDQGVFPGMEEAVKEAKGKGKKAGKVTVTKTDGFFPDPPEGQVPKEDTFIPPKEETEPDCMAAFKDEPEKTETLPPADGFKPEDKETEGKKPKKKAATTKKPAAKAKKK